MTELTIFAAIKNVARQKSLSPVLNSRGGWWPVVREPFAGAWQRNLELKRETILSFHAIFACITLIASDISKMRIKLVRENDGIWVDIPMRGYEVLERPNGYQTRIQFFENWLISKLVRGNTYVLKYRNGSGRVAALYILSPDLVTPLVSESGDVYYQLSRDELTGVGESITVPASEIIHDRFNCLFHPLVGLSPIYACGLSAFQGIKIQENSAHLFQNMSRPSGILTAPGSISDEVAMRLKEHWEANYSGQNMGRVAVLGDDLKYQPLALTAEESQMVEQLRLSAEIVCSTFHVPKYKIVGDAPSYNNIEALEQQYYSQCLQILIESIELLLDEGLEVPDDVGTEFDLDGLIRMDSKTQVETLAAAVKGGIDTHNEARKARNRKPVDGGDSIWSQQQNWPIEVLAERRSVPGSEPVAPAPNQNENEERALLAMIEKGFAHG